MLTTHDEIEARAQALADVGIGEPIFLPEPDEPTIPPQREEPLHDPVMERATPRSGYPGSNATERMLNIQERLFGRR